MLLYNRSLSDGDTETESFYVFRTLNPLVDDTECITDTNLEEMEEYGSFASSTLDWWPQI